MSVPDWEQAGCLCKAVLSAIGVCLGPAHWSGAPHTASAASGFAALARELGRRLGAAHSHCPRRRICRYLQAKHALLHSYQAELCLLCVMNKQRTPISTPWHLW